MKLVIRLYISINLHYFGEGSDAKIRRRVLRALSACVCTMSFRCLVSFVPGERGRDPSEIS